MSKKKQFSQFFIALLLITNFLIMLVWNLKTPLMDDDLWFRYQAVQGHIIRDGIQDYMTWNGRFWGQTFCRVSLLGGQKGSSILNAFLFAILIFLILKITDALQDENFSLLRVVTVISAIYLFTPGFASVFIWRAGVGNYMDTMIIYISYLLLFVNATNKKLACLYLPMLGFFAGWGNENTSGGVILISILVICIQYVFTKRFYLSQMLGLVFSLIGLAILVMSPGGHNRLVTTHPNFLQESIIRRTLSNFKQLVAFILSQKQMVLFFVLLVLVIIVATLYNKNRYQYLIGLSFVIGGVASILVLAFAPEGFNESRAFYGGFILMIVGIFKLLSFNAENRISLIINIISVLIIMLSFYRVVVGYKDAMVFNHNLSARYSIIINSKNKENVYVEPISYNSNNDYSIENSFFELTNDPNAFPNNVYEPYFKVKKIYLK